MSNTAAEKLRQTAEIATKSATASGRSSGGGQLPRRNAGKGVKPPLQKTIRKNVDLSPSDNDRLQEWQLKTARDLGVARVTTQEVLRSLVGMLLDDKNLSDEVMEDIARRRSR